MQSILIIEDDPSYRKTMSLILTKEGFTVFTVDNGEDGVSIIREKRPDLILCDIMMPGVSGHSVLETLNSDSSVANIPFIFVSALDKRSDVRVGMDKGADDYLTKPFTAEELLSAVISRLLKAERLRNPKEKSTLQEDFIILRQRITEREMEVLQMVGKGFPSKEIAQHLGVRISTIHMHRANLMRKLEVSNAANLSYWVAVADLSQRHPAR